MNGRKAKQVRRQMANLRKHAEQLDLSELAKAEVNFLKKRNQPIRAGSCRLWKPQFRNPTREFKRIARRMVDYRQKGESK